jgi:hypothetical protein
MGIHPMDSALVGAGSLWPPTLLDMQTFFCIRKQKSFLYFTLGKARPTASPNFLVLQFQNYCRDRLLFFDPCPCPVSASGTDDTPSMGSVSSVVSFFDEFYYLS